MNFQSPYSRQSFLGFCSTRFLPEDFFTADEAVAPSFQTTCTKDIAFIGACPSLELHVYEIRHASENDPRISLSKETFRLMAEYMVSRALVIFYSKTSDNYRLSLITLDYHVQDGKLTKEFSNPRRYSFFLGPQAKLHTPQQFLIKPGRVKDFDDLQKRFSVEIVNKEFYNEIAKLFTKLVGGERRIGREQIVEKGNLRLPGKSIDEFHQLYQEFAVRLIGRLVFCWFLKKKSSNGGPPLVDDACLSSAAVNEHPNYYHSILEPLFFAVLNTPMEERHEFVKETFVNTPFLNGGLFEPHDDDFYAVDSLQHVSKHINTLKVPDDWFKKLFDVFETYNFTIDENTTVDIELSIDPEMLGRIFENLLAEINPETGETARKATGSYYTPRPYVEYMVDESLKQYLKTKAALDDDTLDKLLSYSQDIELAQSQKDAVLQALDELRALDPACGSGAFPMGLLQKMLLMLQKIDPDARQWQRRILDSIPDPTFRDMIAQKLGNDRDLWDFSRKLGIIRKSIYGVDIQPIAVEISKLRVFLSLIVEEKVDDAKPNRGIEPLPNLEFKFVAANTLIGLPTIGTKSLAETDQIVEQLKKLRERYFTSFGPNKKEIENQFISAQKELAREVLTWNPNNNRAFLIAQWNPFSHSAADFFDPDWMFGINSGFDIIIGNPPYVQLQKDGGKLARQYSDAGFQTFTRTGDIYSLFYEKGWQLLNKSGHLCYITSNKWMRAGYGEKTRSFFLENTGIKTLLDFGDAPIFSNATTYTNILLFAKQQTTETTRVFDMSREKLQDGSLSPHLQKLENVFSAEFLPERFLIARNAEIRLKEKIESLGKPLKEWDVEINYGIKTGLNEAFIIDGAIRRKLIAEDPKCEKIIKPILRGKDIKKYRVEFADLYVIFLPWHFPLHNNHRIQGASHEAEIKFKNEYPAIYRHLSQYKHSLKNRNRAETGIRYEWYALQRCAASYYKEFEKEKIVWGNLSTEASYAFDNTKSIISAPANLLTSESINLKYLLAILNSKLMSFLFKFIAYSREGEFYEFKKVFVEKLPIKAASENVIFEFEKAAKRLISQDVNSSTRANFENHLDLMVYKLYDLTWEEILIVDPQIERLISRQAYDRASIEELSEWGIANEQGVK